MSDTSLYSSLYGQIRECAVLIDEVLIALKSGTSRPSETARLHLAELLLDLAAPRPSDLLLRILQVELQDSPHSNLQDWMQIGHALQQPHMDDRMVERLEAFAHIVDQKRARTLAQMQGWSR